MIPIGNQMARVGASIADSSLTVCVLELYSSQNMGINKSIAVYNKDAAIPLISSILFVDENRPVLLEAEIVVSIGL